MKRLMMTTALVMAIAIPVVATADSSSQASNQTNSTFQAQKMDGEMMDMKASDLIGLDLYIPGKDKDANASADELDTAPAKWKKVGEINDVIIGKDGNVEDVLVDAGGFLGMGENQIRVPLDQIRFETKSDGEEYRAIYDGDRAALSGSDRYDAEKSKSAGETLGAKSLKGMDDQADQKAQPVKLADVTADELTGKTVYDSKNDWVGEISDVQLGDNGDVKALIMDIGGFLGMGEHTVAVPMDKVELRRVDGDDVRAYVLMSEEQLKNLKEWKANDNG